MTLKDGAKLPSPVGRLLLPSFSDILFVLIIFWSFMAGEIGWERLLLDGDTGLHIRIGDYILANHHVPTTDLFAFSRPGETWYAFEWLSETFFSLLHGPFGLKGVALASGLIIAATLTALLRYTLARGANSLIALLLALLTVNAASIHFHARPHIFTLLFMVVTLWLVSDDRQKPSHRIWLLVPLTVAWANLHGGFLILFPLLALLAIGCAAEAYFWGDLAVRRKSDAIRYAIVTAACGLASLINPYGIGLHAHVIEVMRAKWILDLVDEFKAPQFRSEAQLDFMILLFLGLCIIAPLVSKRRVTEALWILFFAYIALTSVRHVPNFAVVAMPIIALQLSEWWTLWVSNQPKTSIARVFDGIATQLGARFNWSSLWIPLTVVFLSLTGSIHWPKDFSEKSFPVSIVQRHAEQIAASRIFTTDQWADYLIYNNYPRQRVFLDGRANYYGEKIMNDYIGLLGGRSEWKQILDQYQFDLVLCPDEMPLVSLMKTDPAWRIVDKEGKTFLFARSTAH